MLELADVSPTRTLDGLTARQRAGLAALLRLRSDQLSCHNGRKAPYERAVRVASST